MSLSASSAARVRKPEPSELGQRLNLRNVDWAAYRKISDALSGRHLRLTFDRGNLEFMTISSLHARLGRLLGRLVAVITEELGLPLGAYGDMTCDRKDLERGIEADECFYIQNEPAVRGKNIDLSRDPPPDLAIEVDSRSSRHRLPVYASLGVREVWRFDGKTLEFLVCDASGSFAPVDKSLQFPMLAAADLLRFLRREAKADDNAIVRSFRSWFRELLAKEQPPRKAGKGTRKKK